MFECFRKNNLSKDVKNNCLPIISDFLINSYLKKLMDEKNDKTVNFYIVEKLNDYIKELPSVMEDKIPVVYIDIEKSLDSFFEKDNYNFDLSMEQLELMDRTWFSDYFDSKANDSKRNINNFTYDKVK